MNFNIRDYVSDDHIESIGEIATSQARIIQALSLDNSQKDKEIERLNNIIKEIDNAFKYENLHNNMELVREIKRILINEYYKGVDKE